MTGLVALPLALPIGLPGLTATTLFQLPKPGGCSGSAATKDSLLRWLR